MFYLLGLTGVMAASVLAASPAVHVAAPAPGYHVLKKVTVGGVGGWDYLTVDGMARRLYITRGTHVMVLDLDSAKIVGDITNTPGVHGVAIASALGRGYTSNGGDNTVTVFDLKTLKELSRIAVGRRPDAILFDPATKRIFTFNAGSSDATAVDTETGTVAGSVPLGGKPEFAVSDEHGSVFVNVEDKSEIIEFDAKGLTVKHHWPLAPGDGPSGLAFDRKNHRLFAVCGNGKMVIIDSLGGKVVATPAIGQGPDAAIFDPAARLAFSSNGADGTLTVISEETADKFIVAETVPTQAGARTMALDPKTRHIILVSARSKAPAPGPANTRRRNYESGSFEVIIVGK